MLRYPLVLATTLMTSAPAPGRAAATPEVDVQSILDAARGAPRELCRLAAAAVNNGNWGRAGDAPVTPLGPSARPDRRTDADSFSAADRALLLAGVENSDPCVRELSVRMLGRDESATVRDAFAERLTSADSAIREVAAFGLGMVDADGAAAPLIRALKDHAAGVRANAAWALGRADAPSAFRPLLAAASDPVEIVRVSVIESLGRSDSTGAIPILDRLIRTDPSPLVRRTAAWALGEIGDKAGDEALIVALDDHDDGVREMSAWAIGEIGGDVAPPALVAHMLHDDAADVREMAVWSAAEIGDQNASATIARALGSDHSARVRATAAWALGELGGSTAPSALIDALGDSSARVRLPAAWALSQIGDPAATRALNAALTRERDPEIQKAEIRALIHAGSQPEELASLLESKDATVRAAVTRALAGGHRIDPWPWPQPRPRPFP